ncbi:uncharacterized protein [Paramisgurnus dabryanus]|uniref:uncharacterized protein n=1 Tax=Paramisgurnus dabryanus TaxID=90735 RepID=UPI0031F468E5
MYQFPGFIEVPIGGDIFLNCNTMGASPCDRISWYKVSRMGQMKNVTAVLGNKSPNDYLCTLTIPNATPKDSGTYYCSGSYSVLSYIGNGSIVITIDPNAKPSSTTTYVSASNALSEETEPSVISLQCVVMGVGTSQARVFWMIEEKERTGWTESNWANGSDSFTPFIRAHASVSAEEWTIGPEIKCVVEFNGMIFSKKSLQIYDSNSICSLLMYVGSAVAFLIIAVTVIIVFKRNLERTLWSLICARNR